MRSRYTAYAMGKIEYLQATLRAADRQGFDPDSATEWAASAEWKGFEIVNTVHGGNDDDTGEVEFIAHYVLNGQNQVHHECASFGRENGKWVFMEGSMIGHEPFRREHPKVGRNAPCACKSGRKHKKCCGAKA